MIRSAHYLNVAHFLDHFFLLIFPTAVLALHAQWQMSYGEALRLGTPAFVVFAAATPVAGWLGDRWGARPMIIVFFFGIGLSSIATGLTVGPATFAVGLAAVGLFASIYHPVGTALLVRSATRRGRALGINGVFGNMGVAGAALVTAWLTSQLGWRAAFVAPGLVSCVVGVGFLACRDGEGKAVAAPAAEERARRPDGQLQVLVVVAVASLLGGAVFNGLTVAVPKLFSERLVQSDLSLVGTYVSLVFAIAAFTQIPVGRLLDRVGAKPIILTLSSAQCLLLLAMTQVEGPLIILLAVPLMLAVFGEIPVCAWLVSHYVSARWRARAYSGQFLLSLGVGAAMVPFLAYAHERTGSMQLALWVFAAGAGMIAVVALVLLPGRRRARAAGLLGEGEAA